MPLDFGNKINKLNCYSLKNIICIVGDFVQYYFKINK